MKVSILYDSWSGTEAYPGESAEKKGGRRRRRPKLDREQIDDALQKLGHETEMLELDGRDSTLAAVARSKSDLIFNLVESYGGDDSKDMNVAAYLDLVGKRYTGSGPRALHLAQDKAIAKKIAGFHGLRTPFSLVWDHGRLDHAQDVEFPLIVKPTSEDGSIGIDQGAVVGSIKELMERIDYLYREFDSPALVEEYIEGREIYVGVIGNEKAEALPPVELDLSKLPDDMPKIAGYEVKFERDSEAYKVTKSAVAEDLDQETIGRLSETALVAYHALQLRDYGRIDIRLSADGKIYMIEANPNPWLSSAAEFAMAARSAGRTYTQLIEEIVSLAMER
jgi:D-alanine-D-alanine ligase and related ATP-grasp enzymes